jgi:hypothetical protein
MTQTKTVLQLLREKVTEEVRPLIAQEALIKLEADTPIGVAGSIRVMESGFLKEKKPRTPIGFSRREHEGD